MRNLKRGISLSLAVLGISLFSAPDAKSDMVNMVNRDCRINAYLTYNYLSNAHVYHYIADIYQRYAIQYRYPFYHHIARSYRKYANYYQSIYFDQAMQLNRCEAKPRFIYGVPGQGENELGNDGNSNNGNDGGGGGN